MQAESLEVLEKAQVAPAQARAFVRAIEIEIAGARDTLATKSDLLALKHDFDVLRAELRGEMMQLRAELRGEMAEIRAELHRSIGQIYDSPTLGFHMQPCIITVMIHVTK
jgi:hypothetical protein